MGVGMANPGEVTKDDDPFDQYRKRMQLAYKFRPNPNNNPRRAYDGYQTLGPSEIFICSHSQQRA